jgi:hypothetical protein
VGRATRAKHDLYLDAFDPSRLHELYRQDVGHDDIVAVLAPLIKQYAKERAAGERFGGFVIRQGFVAPTPSGRATPTSARTSHHKPSGWALTARGSQLSRSAARARPDEIARRPTRHRRAHRARIALIHRVRAALSGRGSPLAIASDRMLL